MKGDSPFETRGTGGDAAPWRLPVAWQTLLVRNSEQLNKATKMKLLRQVCSAQGPAAGK